MNDYETLKILSIIRLIVTIYLLFFTKTSLFMKILFVYIVDMIDYNPIIGKLFYKNSKYTETYTYEQYDKISDLISYILLLVFIYSNNHIPINYKHSLLLLLIFRIVGIALFLSTNNTKYLFYFPNFFLEFTLLFSLIFEQKYTNLNTPFRFFLVFVLKILQEYLMHYNKDIRNILKDYEKLILNM